MVKFDESEGRWVTINGMHIFIQDKDAGGIKYGSKSSGRQPSFVKKSASGQTEIHKNLVNKVWASHKDEHKAAYAKLKELHERKLESDEKYVVARDKIRDLEKQPGFNIKDPEWKAKYDVLFADAQKQSNEWNKLCNEVRSHTERIQEMKEKIRNEAHSVLFPSARDPTAHQTVVNAGGYFTVDEKTFSEAAKANFNLNGFIVSDKLGECKVFKSNDGRCHENVGDIFLANGSDVGDAMHEMGHAFESRDPSILRQSLKFLNDRTSGENLVTMNSLSPFGGYRPDERVKKDKFLDPYCGKDYGGRATEIMSMGFQMMWRMPVEFALKDPDYFNYVVRVSKGVKPKQVRRRRAEVKPKSKRKK